MLQLSQREIILYGKDVHFLTEWDIDQVERAAGGYSIANLIRIGVPVFPEVMSQCPAR